MWVSLFILTVWFHNPFVHTAPISMPNIGDKTNFELLFPQTDTSSAQLQPALENDPILWKQQKENRFNAAMINVPIYMPRVMAKLEEIILRLIDGNDASNQTKLQDSVETEIYAKLLQNISSEFVREEKYLVKQQEQETRIKKAQDEAIQSTSLAISNLSSTVLALEEKINAIESQVKPAIKTNILDTRSENLTPSQYRSKGVGVYHEYKENRKIDLPLVLGYPPTDDLSYAVLKTVVPWGDTSGGYVIQIAYAGNATRMRTEDFDDSTPVQWSPWQNPSELNKL